MQCVRIIINFLKDAYAMEEAIIEILEQHASDTEDIDIKMALEDKVESIAEQAEKIKDRVEELDDEVSTAKTGLAFVIRNMEEYHQGFEKGRIIKDTIIEYGIDCFQKATFKAIFTAAEVCRDDKTMKLCEELIGDERGTSEYLDHNLAGVVINYINHETIEKEDIDYTGEEEI
ncbi:MAG: ferritin-like domain-containing protein [Patescibacteria group bacterium]|nr:ferritin-like domain-containing protein [Patescibacteria group bacterium]